MKKNKPRCSECQKTFTPHRKVGERQKTCSPECSRERHRKKCKSWNRKHSHLSRIPQLEKKLKKLKANNETAKESHDIRRENRLGFPSQVIKDEIFTQVAVILDLALQVLVKRVVRREKNRNDPLPDG